MNIDGISGGVSGLPESFMSQVAQTDGDYLSQIVDHEKYNFKKVGLRKKYYNGINNAVIMTKDLKNF